MIPTVFVRGNPAPQGSKTYKGHRNGRPILVESSKKLEPWRDRVAAEVRRNGRRIDAGIPVHVAITFVMPRPKATPKTRPTPPAVKYPDLDKLIRGVFDGLAAGGAVANDSQIVRCRNVEKRIAEVGEEPGAWITWFADGDDRIYVPTVQYCSQTFDGEWICPPRCAGHT